MTRLHNSYMHPGKTKEYAYTTTLRLGDLNGAEFSDEMAKIANEMLEGEFKILEIPHGWKTMWEPAMTAPRDPKIRPEWITE